jgi:acyl-CoA hydrolase
MTELVLPSHTNALGTIFGGVVMSWIDIAGASAAMKHARSVVVTASLDALNFVAPIRLGALVTLKARVNAVHRSSMEVGVRVDSENPLTGESSHNATAYLTFVALDSQGKPHPVVPLNSATEVDRRRAAEALKRREFRQKLREALKSS